MKATSKLAVWVIAAALLLSACAPAGGTGAAVDGAAAPTSTPSIPTTSTSGPTSVRDTPSSTSGWVVTTVPPPISLAESTLGVWEAAVSRAPEGAVFPAGEAAYPFGLWERRGDWSQWDTTGEAETAIDAGAVQFTAADTGAPGEGTVRTPGRDDSAVPVMDAAAAVAAIRAGGNGQDCGGCSVTLVDPVFSAMGLATAYGVASVPAWEFTIAGTPARLARVAVSPSHLLTVDTVPGLTEAMKDAGYALELSGARATGPASVQVNVTGGVAPCHQGFIAEAVETAHTFTVVVAEVAETTMSCNAMGVDYPVEVQLSAPIGDRIMINTGRGTPLEFER